MATLTYWDTSALVKLYATEADTPFFVRLMGEMYSRSLTSAITQTEMLCALYRKERIQALRKGAAAVLLNQFDRDVQSGRLVLVPYDADVTKSAATIAKKLQRRRPPILLRSLDMIHLASAVSGNAQTVVTTDTRLRDAAAGAGLKFLP